MTAQAAAAAAAGAVLVLLLLTAPPLVVLTGRASPRTTSSAAVLLGTSLLAGSAALLLSGTHLVLGLIIGTVLVGTLLLVRRRRAATTADARRDQVLEAADSMAVDLSAGATPRAALDRAAADFSMLVPVAAAAHVDADVPAAFRAVAATPGCQELRLVAAAWQVTHRAGSSLAPALSATAETLREQRSTQRLIASELAGARATAWLMAGLPLLVLLFGSSVGGDPVGFLVGNPFGLGCLGGGLALTLLGWWWLERLALAVTR